jgi:hypothetical protein
MDRRRIARTLGVAAGGLLGAAFLPAAVAFADDYDIVADPTSTEAITGIYGYGFGGLYTAPPSVPGSIQGDQDFDYTDTSTGDTGTFFGFESNATDGFGDTNQEVYVVSDVSGTDAPPVGSVFDTYTLGDGGFEGIYSAIPLATGDQISYTLVTPFGDYPVPVTFDAANVTAADDGGVPIGNGDDLDPVTTAGSQVLTAINGNPPLTVNLQGIQLFEIDNSPNNAFDADETTTTDALGTYTEAVLVTQDQTGTVGTAAGDTPAVGSVFNTITLGGIENVYSDLASTTGGAGVITDTVETPLGDFTIPVTFDAADAEVSAPIDLPNGDDLVPASTLDFTGINGLPPADVAVEGTQVFDYTDGAQSGSFDADVTNTLDSFDDFTETVLVTSGSDPDAPVGSVFQTVSLGDSGFESIYSDIASTAAGGDVISDTLVTPFGDFTIPLTLDASASLASDLFS